MLNHGKAVTLEVLESSSLPEGRGCGKQLGFVGVEPVLGQDVKHRHLTKGLFEGRHSLDPDAPFVHLDLVTYTDPKSREPLREDDKY